MEAFDRVKLLIGEENYKKLASSHVAVFGVGGVGGFTAEALVRSGVGEITLFDNDVFSFSNLNRQIFSTVDKIGREKTEVAKERLLSINPNLKIHVNNVFYLPENADNKNVTWSSSDKKVATVKDGKVTGIGKGTANITVKTEDGGFVDVCSVTVLQNVTEISVKNKEYTIKEGTIIKVEAFAMPENAENRAITWESSDESVATVNNGEIKGVGKGEAEITISSVYTKGVSTKIKVIVTKPVAGISLNKTLAETNVGGKIVLEATVTPADANNQKLIWTSSDEKIATVDNGVVTTKSRGEVVITVSTVDGGYTATCRINVIQPVTHIKLDSDAYYLYKGEPITIKFEVYPENANDKTLTWTSSDETVLTVENGVVTPLKPGTAEITVTDSTGVIKVKVIATVVSKVTGVTISKEEVTLKMGETAALEATIQPEDATNKNFSWSSSDEAVAVIKNGIVTPVSAGTTIITVTTDDGKFMATCLVTVTE